MDNNTAYFYVGKGGGLVPLDYWSKLPPVAVVSAEEHNLNIYLGLAIGYGTGNPDISRDEEVFRSVPDPQTMSWWIYSPPG